MVDNEELTRKHRTYFNTQIVVQIKVNRNSIANNVIYQFIFKNKLKESS